MNAMPESTHVRVAANLGRVDLLLHWAMRAHGVAERRFFLGEARRALPLLEPHALSIADAKLAEALGVAAARAAATSDVVPPHSVIVPFALASLGLSRRVVVSYAAFDEQEAVQLSGETRAAVRDALRCATTFGRASQPLDRYRLTMWRPGLENSLFVTGQSLGPAVLVSACSLWTERSVKAGTAITAILSARDVTPAGGLAEKIEGLSFRGDLTRLIVARGEGAIARSLFAARQRSDVAVVEVSNVDELLDAALEPERASVVDVDEAVQTLRRDFERGWEAFEWPTLRERAERLLGSMSAHRPDIEVDLWTMTAAARRHAGDAQGSFRAINKAKSLARRHARSVPDAVLCRLHLHASMTLLGLGRRSAARVEAETARDLAKRARLVGEEIKALGCVGLVARALGNVVDAIQAQEAALTLVHSYRPTGCARTHAYIIDALGMKGDVSRARKSFHNALDHLHGLPQRRARDHESWLRIAFGGALVRNARSREALLVLDVPCVHERIQADANPGLWARRYLGLALMHDVATFDRGAALLAQSPGAYALEPRSKLAKSALLNVLLEADASIRANRMTLEVEARALLAMERLGARGANARSRLTKASLQRAIAKAEESGA